MINYRQLSEKEKATLVVYGCSSDNWLQILVPEDFSPAYISNVHFSGKIFLGTYNKIFDLAGGVKKHSGIFNCILHDCKVGNDVFIDKIHNYIANYEIGEGAYIENVDLIVTDEKSSFGNGTKIPVMIESGGREVTIFDQLSAPLAYIMTFYRHNTDLINRLNDSINQYVESLKSEKGYIGTNTKIVNSGKLRNVRIGDFTIVEGIISLENGTIVSNEKAPGFIGAGVQCKNFIIQSGTSVTESVLISNCFIGQACQIGKQFSAIDSLFFANCQGLHGEAVSVFAGPYTVTHHKSTLMLTALYSFMNAGSGTNFSNHMYKLGPVHQGITERGVKTSSNSYIMWPAKIGAYSVVLGKHKGNPDISDLPFSYLIENDGESTLSPGINLHSAGTIRDVQKWPKRDLRNDCGKLDPINFNFLSPYTIFKALNGIEILKNLLKNMDEKSTFVWYQNCKIKRSSIKKGIELYEMAVDNFIGGELKRRLNFDSNNLYSENETGVGKWIDLAGLLAPKSEVDKLINRIILEEVSLNDIQAKFNAINENYDSYSWSFAKDVIEKQVGKEIQNLNKQEIEVLIEKGKKAESNFKDLILRDAKKEFNSISKTGFGIDSEEDKNADFENVRGTFENHPFVIDIQIQ